MEKETKNNYELDLTPFIGGNDVHIRYTLTDTDAFKTYLKNTLCVDLKVNDIAPVTQMGFAFNGCKKDQEFLYNKPQYIHVVSSASSYTFNVEGGSVTCRSHGGIYNKVLNALADIIEQYNYDPNYGITFIIV